MEHERWQRRRSTLLSADVVGYCRLMERDEPRALLQLIDAMACMQREVARFGGRVVDAPGDNLLAEFAHENAALQCAIAIQQQLAQRNARVPESEQLLLRIGLHSGELMAHEGRLYGKAVNIAARLQQAARPASILLSEAVAERVDALSARVLHELGRFHYKNMTEAIPTLQACVGE